MSTRWTQADVDAAVRKHALPPITRLAKPSKYRNVKSGSYASKREAKRAQELKAMEVAYQIHDLQEQVTFELLPAQYENGKCVERAIKYIADFTYTTGPGGNLVVEDAKGFRDPIYRMKRKLMLSVHGIRIREV